MTRPAPTQASIRLVKTFTYEGQPGRTFSNRYFFDGGSVGDSTAWHTFMDAVVAIEKSIYHDAVTITEALGFVPGTDVPVASKSYTVVGTLAQGAALNTPGQCAIVLRMATTKRSVKNHPVYVFSYYHRALLGSSGAPETLYAAQKTAVELYADDWLNGITVGARTYKRVTPDGHPVTGRLVSQFIGHRDFPS